MEFWNDAIPPIPLSNWRGSAYELTLAEVWRWEGLGYTGYSPE